MAHGEAGVLPPSRALRKNIPRPWLLQLPSSNSTSTQRDQLNGLPQIPQRHLVGGVREGTRNASGPRLLRRAETIFAIVQDLSTANVLDRGRLRRRLLNIIKGDGHTLFEYHTTFVLHTKLESTSDGCDWASRLPMLWKSLSGPCKEWWREHTEQILHGLDDELDLSVPRNFQTGDATSLSKVYAWRVKTTLRRQRIDVPEQRPGQKLIKVSNLHSPQDAREQAATHDQDREPVLTNVYALAHTTAESPRAHISRPTRDSRDLPTHTVVVDFLFSCGEPSRSHSVEAVRERLLQAIWTLVEEDPGLQVYCRGAGARVNYENSAIGVTSVAARLLAAENQAGKDGSKRVALINSILEPFAYYNISARGFKRFRGKSSEDYIPEDPASCLAWLGGKIDNISWGKRKNVVNTIMNALCQHIARVGETTPSVCFQAQEIVTEIKEHISSFGKFSVVRNSLGFEQQLLRCFDDPALRPSEYEDLLEQSLYAFQTHTGCDFMLDRMVER